MKKLTVFLCIMALGALAMAGIANFTWGVMGAQSEAAQVNAAMSSMEGLLKANPFGVDNPALMQVMADNASDLRTAMNSLSAKIGDAMPTLTQEDRQAALDGYGEFLIGLADIKRQADNRFLTDVSANLGETYTAHGLNGFVWGATYGLKSLRLPELGL